MPLHFQTPFLSFCVWLFANYQLPFPMANRTVSTVSWFVDQFHSKNACQQIMNTTCVNRKLNQVTNEIFRTHDVTWQINKF